MSLRRVEATPPPRELTLLGTGTAVRQALGDLDEARHAAYVACFSLPDAGVARSLAAALARAAGRGVDVRFLYDPFGTRATARRFFDDLVASGASVLAYRPPGASLLRSTQAPRHHAGLVVADGWAHLRGGVWGEPRDLAFRVRGPVADDVAALFLQRWAEAGGQAIAADFDTGDRHPDVQLLSDAPVTESLVLAAQIDAFGKARRRVWVASASAFPAKALREALVAAAERGVDVQLLIPRVRDRPLFTRAARADLDEWRRSGVRVWVHPDTEVTCTYALADDAWGLVGSMDAQPVRSAEMVESALVVRRPEPAALLAERFVLDRAGAVPLEVENDGGDTWGRLVDELAHGLVTTLGALFERRPATALEPPRPVPPSPAAPEERER